MTINFDFCKLLHNTDKSIKREFLSGNFGIEKENVRVNEKGELSLKPHPEAFGNKLYNPYITTDFSESQLEMVTPVFNSITDAYDFLENLHDMISLELKDEYLWPQSMPPILPNDDEILISQYDDSAKGNEEEIYRKNLAYKYGKKALMISGLHYNFSFSDKLLNKLYKNTESDIEFKAFKDNLYLKLSRNFLRYRWLLIYLFGSTPLIHKTLDLNLDTNHLTKTEESSYLEYGTSLRVSNRGYTNQKELELSYNSMEEYIDSFDQILASNIIQCEKELYSPIRLRSATGPFKLSKLKQQGIEYIEIRLFDINPYHKLGISISELRFIHLFMLYCLFGNDNIITKEEQSVCNHNHEVVCLNGRMEGLEIYKSINKKVTLEDWATEILCEIKDIAEALSNDAEEWLASVLEQIDKVKDKEKLPSSQVVKEANKNSFIQSNIKRAIDYKNNSKKHSFMLKGYEDLELSTQILIKEAIKRGIRFKLLDRKENFISLESGGKVEYIKQATKTSLDSYITYLIMENKLVSKQALEKANINTPPGDEFTQIQEAINNYEFMVGKDIVIKPKSTNFGIGISIIKNLDSLDVYKRAIEIAFSYDDAILIEDFFEGKEYRFLVIGDEVLGILHRIPANVIGDGIRNIKQLVEIKNLDPLRGKGYKTPLEKIALGEEELMFLKMQNKDFNYIPQKGEKVFLRENSNISTGGDSIDYTDNINDSYKEIAVKAAQSVKAKICGVDMMIKNIETQATEDNYSIIEINFNPAIHIHDFPYIGENRKVEKKVLDLLMG